MNNLEAKQIESRCIMEFMRQCQMLKLEKAVPEYEFDPESKCRADRAFLRRRVLVEFEGWGHMTKGRFATDLRKYNRATILGWRLIRLTPRMVLSGESIEVMRQTFFPVPNYLSRCMVCLEEYGEIVHQECFENLLNEGETENYECIEEHGNVREITRENTTGITTNAQARQ